MAVQCLNKAAVKFAGESPKVRTAVGGIIGTIGQEAEAARRMPGSLAVALWGVSQGVQMIRVHDVAETRQALSLWQATTQGGPS